jgi:cobalamin biosynthesis protein CbiM
MAHIPDGFLSASVSAGTFVAAGALTAVAARQAKARLDDRAAPTLGLATAAVFAAQAVNFPVAAGTSGHLLGGVAFGPWAGFLVMTAVVIAQALIFADGGLTALGANVLNIAGAGALLGYAVYRVLTGLAGEGPLRRALGAAVAAYLAALLTGIAAGLELGLSGIAPTRLSVGAMASVHAVIGLAEAAITGLAVWALARKRPDLLFRPRGSAAAKPPPAVVLAGLGVVAISDPTCYSDRGARRRRSRLRPSCWRAWGSSRSSPASSRSSHRQRPTVSSAWRSTWGSPTRPPPGRRHRSPAIGPGSRER